MKVRELIQSLTEDMLDVPVKLVVSDSTGQYTRYKSPERVELKIKHKYVGTEFERIDPDNSVIEIVAGNIYMG